MMDCPSDWVASAEDLAAAAVAWRRSDALAIDTEFVRERTFYARLGLVQVSDGERAWLVDPLAIEDLDPLAAMLSDPATLKIAHSCSEDLEVLYHRFGAFPSPLFDTQVAAALAGTGHSLGYQRLVAELLAVDLPKGETRTDWLRRPLSPEQLTYAAHDVCYLLPVYRRLRDELEARGRVEWVVAESQQLEDPTRFLPAVEDAYLRLGGIGRLDRRQLAAARELAAWREAEARRRDLPRNFVLRENALVHLARHMPVEAAQLEGVPELAPGQIRRDGAAILAAIAKARELPAETLPARPPGLPHDEAMKKLLRDLQEEVARQAARLDVPATLLASRRDLRDLVRHAARDLPLPPASLAGWRWREAGPALAPILEDARRRGVLAAETTADRRGGGIA